MVVFILLYIVTKKSDTGLLAAFSVSMEFMSFILVPLIAIMRSSAIYLAQSQQSVTNLKIISFSLARQLWVFPASITIVLILFGKELGLFWYKLSPQAMSWWQPFIIVCALSIPILYLDYFLRGAFQAKKMLKPIAITEIFSKWLLSVPLFILAIYFNNPWLLWIGIFGTSLFIFLKLNFLKVQEL